MAPSFQSKPVTGLILAGGRSSRMGQDKASLTIDGISLLEKNKQLLAQLKFKSILVSGSDTGQIPDKIEQAGPLGGICAALDRVDAEHALLVLPVDMPKLNKSLLTQLIDTGSRLKSACYFEDYFFPAFFYDVNVLKQVASQLIVKPGKARSVSALLNAVNAQAICFSDPEMEKNLINVNTPEQWRAYIESHA